jgi:hypothetical protein
MFAVATFRSRKLVPRVVVPSTAVMRLQDKDWIFRKDGASTFRRLQVHVIGSTQDGMSQLQDEVKAGEQLIANALEFSTAMAQQGSK